jgi:hypothetical protein
MRTWILPLGLAAALVNAQPLLAQYRTTRPPVSPYLEIIRRDSAAGINYYNLVKPQFEFRGAIQQLQQGVRTNEQTLTDLQGETLPTTGHAAGFGTHLGYFQNIGGARGASPVRPIVARPISTRTIGR